MNGPRTASAVDEPWFEDMEAMRASAASAAYAATREDEKNFLGAPLKLPFIIATERVLVG